MKSIQTKLAVVFLSILLCSLAVLGGMNYWQARSVLNDSIQDNYLELADTLNGSVESWLNGRREELSMLANTSVLKRGDKAEISAFLGEIGKGLKSYERILYLDAAGNSVYAEGPGPNFSDREYFKHGIKGELYISDPYVSRTTGSLVMAVVAPVQDNGRVTGLMMGTLSMEGVNQRILALKVAQTGYAMVLMQDGTVLVHPDKESVMKTNFMKDEAVPASLKELSERVVQGERGIGFYEQNNVEKIAAFIPMSGIQWYLIIAAPLQEVTGVLDKLAMSTLAVAGIVLLLAAAAIVWFARQIANPIHMLEKTADRIADGDLSALQFRIDSRDEIGRLGNSFEKMTENLRALISRILSATEQLAAASQQMTASSEQSAQAANQVASTVTETAQGTSEQVKATDNALERVKKMSGKAEQGSSNAGRAVAMTNQAVDAAAGGSEAVTTAIAQMRQIQVTVADSAKVIEELEERSKQIGQIVETIAGIAGQTNLLALNAAIEAARAGEQGRGFAVVAEEVRKLAEDSQEAAKQIADLIHDIRAKTETAVQAMQEGTTEVQLGTEVVDKAGQAFAAIVEQVKEAASIVEGTAKELLELAEDSKQVLQVVQQVDAISREITGQTQNISAATEEQSASIEEIASSSRTLSTLAEDLQKAVLRFKI